MLDVRRLRMLRELALHGTIRAAAESLSFSPAAVELVPLLEDPVQVVLPRRHPAAVRATVDLAELAAEPWLNSTSLSSCRPFVPRACNAAGFEPRVAAETNDHRTMHRLIAAGVGLALVPVLSQLDLPPALVARPIWPNPPK